tara:strand:+ start:248 stop:415 length:168 start_codon:yes stop_codon:yes gene_type:complete
MGHQRQRHAFLAYLEDNFMKGGVNDIAFFKTKNHQYFVSDFYEWNLWNEVRGSFV